MAVNERDHFLKTMGKRVSDTDIMKNVCLAMGMKDHQIESHLTDYPKNINEAAYEAFLKWWTENTADNKPERELLTILKGAFREAGIERRWIEAYHKHEIWCKRILELAEDDSVDGIDVNGGGDTSSQTSGISSQLTLGINVSNTSAEGAVAGTSSGDGSSGIVLRGYNNFAEIQTLPLKSKVKIVGKVKSDEKRKLKKPVREIQLVDSEMKELKVTIFGNIPKMDGSGLRKGRVLEVSGIILDNGARYICVSYDTKGSMIKVLPKDDEVSQHISSTVGKKRKSKSNISQATEVRTIKDLNSSGTLGQFRIQNCIVSTAFPNTYFACKSCKTKKDGDKCTNPKCKSKSKNKEKTLRINVTLEDKSARGEERVKAVMFGNVCTNIMGITAKTFMKKTNNDQKTLCINKYVGKDFSVDIDIAGPNSWVIKQIQRE